RVRVRLPCAGAAGHRDRCPARARRSRDHHPTAAARRRACPYRRVAPLPERRRLNVFGRGTQAAGPPRDGPSPAAGGACPVRSRSARRQRLRERLGGALHPLPAVGLSAVAFRAVGDDAAVAGLDAPAPAAVFPAVDLDLHGLSLPSAPPAVPPAPAAAPVPARPAAPRRAPSARRSHPPRAARSPRRSCPAARRYRRRPAARGTDP